jgi:hypothetical protein
MALIGCEMVPLSVSLIVHPHRMCVISLIRCEGSADRFFDCPPTQLVRDHVNLL